MREDGGGYLGEWIHRELCDQGRRMVRSRGKIWRREVGVGEKRRRRERKKEDQPKGYTKKGVTLAYVLLHTKGTNTWLTLYMSPWYEQSTCILKRGSVGGILLSS
jgi:hypothetical protein